MEKKKSKMHTKKFRTIALSIFFAIIVWFAVIYVNDPDITTTVSDLNVRFVGEMNLRDKQLAITGKSDIPPLSAVVTGKRSDLINFMDNIYVQINVDDINSVGEYNLSGVISLPTTRITVEKENYGEIPVKVEKLESKDVEVSVKQTGSLKNKLVKSEIINPTVTITGAASELETVHGAVATVDISDLRDDSIERVSYLLTNEAGALINTNETLESMRSYVEVENTIYEEKTLPVEAVLSAELENDYIMKADKTVITPETITVGITPDNTDDKVIVRIDRIDESGNGEYDAETGNGMYIPQESRSVKVKTEIVRKAVEQLELEVRAENVPEGHTVVIPENLTALVWGETGRINTDSVSAVVDLSGLSAGEYLLPVKLAGENAGFMEDYKINVIIE